MGGAGFEAAACGGRQKCGIPCVTTRVRSTERVSRPVSRVAVTKHNGVAPASGQVPEFLCPPRSVYLYRPPLGILYMYYC